MIKKTKKHFDLHNKYVHFVFLFIPNNFNT